ncbi:MAG: hypothetical protein KKH72_11515 [Alphaproteobacteria bacterium]|nr:hypothetical protein [Alphaproteobacteria bacterium]
MQRRDFELLALGLLVMPPLAAVLFMSATALSRAGPAGLASLDIGFLVGTFPFSYLLSLPPSLAAMAANAMVGRWLGGQAERLLMSLPIGIVPFLVILGWLATDDKTGQLRLAEYGGLAAAGALASLACVGLVEAFGTPPGGRR